MRRLSLVLVLLGTSLLLAESPPQKDPVPPSSSSAQTDKTKTDADKTGTAKPDAAKTPEPPRELFSGKVVWVQDALKRKGIKVADEMKLQAVLETDSGELIPIAADWRGRAFFQDAKLRDRPVDLVGYRRPGLPYLQVLVVYTFDEKRQRQETDYWCDICSIPMFEIKECECCQGPIQLRYRPAKLPDYLKSSEARPRRE